MGCICLFRESAPSHDAASSTKSPHQDAPHGAPDDENQDQDQDFFVPPLSPEKVHAIEQWFDALPQPADLIHYAIDDPVIPDIGDQAAAETSSVPVPQRSGLTTSLLNPERTDNGSSCGAEPPLSSPLAANTNIDSNTLLVQSVEDVGPAIGSNLPETNQPPAPHPSSTQSLIAELQQWRSHLRPSDLELEKMGQKQLEELLMRMRNAQEDVQRLKLERLLCVVCMEREKEVIFVPCHHKCSCPQCAEKLEQCPVCRANIQDKIQPY